MTSNALARYRPLIALIGVIAVFGAVLWGILGKVLPSRAPPEVAAMQSVTRPLTRHLLLIIIDGLRWDVANDAARMPNLSRAIEEQASGELWAGRVSMTTSAVLTMVTGERGGFEQVVFNADPSPPPFDSWLASAKRQKLTVMHVGDPAWKRMFGGSIDESRLDPEGVAIDVDFNPQTFRDARALAKKRPNVLIVHFVTPDHQAHAHTVLSPKFAEHIRGFDRDLAQFLKELPRDWTVVVAGDHGAADSGTHGADTPIQRRSALYAYGPGIEKGARTSGRIDQADLAGTFAALLGLPTPSHSRGHVLTSFLELPPRERQKLACADAERAARLAHSRGLPQIAAEAERLARGCATQAVPEALTVARAAVGAVDRGIDESTGLAAPIVLPLVAITTLAALITVLALLGAKAISGALIALGLGAIAVLLTWGVERLPGMQPHATRIGLFVLGNLVALALLALPGRVYRLSERFPSVAPALFPGLLVATYTTNAQPEAYVAVVVGLVLFVLVGGLSPKRDSLRASAPALRPFELLVALGAALLLFFPGTRTSDVVPDWARRDGGLSLALGAALLLAVALVLAAHARQPRRWHLALTGAALAAGALALRRIVWPWPGRLAIVIGLGLAIVFALRGRKLSALLAGLFSYAWISRDFEIVTLSASLIVADLAGLAWARHRDRDGRGSRALALPELLLAVTFLFGLAFVQRIGLQGAIDFGSMDWGAAGFGDPHVPAWIIGAALALKYALALVLCVGAFVAELPRVAATQVLKACFVAYLARGVVLTAMFLIAGGSFWTGLRVLGDLPFGFLWATAIALFWLALSGRARATAGA